MTPPSQGPYKSSPFPSRGSTLDYKTCPGCGEEVPSAAPRCKHCFHDFGPEVKPRSRRLVGLFIILAIMAVSGAAVMFYITNFHSVKENVVIDEETKSVVFTRTYADKLESDRLSFNDVEKIESVVGGSKWEVALLLKNGDRKVINRSVDQNLHPYAVHIAAVMERPLVQVNEIAGFGEQKGTSEIAVDDLPTGDSKKAKEKSSRTSRER